ncbi:MAG TPA: glycosyltransferase family 4 protein [Longimicrobiaceae bacterium]|nr:glycosyltransferase family 4 protein [Longimicrobiaceae bacterium]
MSTPGALTHSRTHALPFHLITGEYPPQRGGVADYTRVLAHGLAAAGREVHVWAPGTGGGESGVRVHPVAGFGRAGRAGLGRELDRFPAPRTLVVQYAPRAFGMHGMNVGFCRWVLGRARAGDDVRVMFHEPYFPFGWPRPQRNLLAVASRVMAMLLLRAARRAYVSTPAWETLLRPWAPRGLGRMRWLPIPSSVPRVDDPEGVAVLRARLRGGDPASHVVAHFGTYGNLVARLLEPALLAILSPPSRAVALLLGEGGPAFAARLEHANPALRGRIAAPGWLPPERLSIHLQASDVAVQPYPDGASSRRTTLMAALANGAPAVTTGGRFTEELWRGGPLPLAPAGDPGAVAVAVLDLLDDRERRARVGREGRAFYARHFSLERTIDALLAPEDD